MLSRRPTSQDHKVVSIGEGLHPNEASFHAQQGNRYFVLILRYAHLDKLIYSPPHPGRGLKVSSDYCPSIEGCVQSHSSEVLVLQSPAGSTPRPPPPQGPGSLMSL